MHNRAHYEFCVKRERHYTRIRLKWIQGANCNDKFINIRKVYDVTVTPPHAVKIMSQTLFIL